MEGATREYRIKAPKNQFMQNNIEKPINKKVPKEIPKKKKISYIHGINTG